MRKGLGNLIDRGAITALLGGAGADVSSGHDREQGVTDSLVKDDSGRSPRFGAVLIKRIPQPPEYNS